MAWRFIRLSMDTNQIDYIQRLIGQPWERRGLHCWALVRDVQSNVYGREIPDGPMGVPTRSKRRELLSRDAKPFGWREVTGPQDGAVVRMHHLGGNPNDLEHAGVWIDVDGGRVLHTDNPHGVVADTLAEIHLRGWVPRFFVPDTGEDNEQEAADRNNP
jgi:hypothetical protein